MLPRWLWTSKGNVIDIGRYRLFRRRWWIIALAAALFLPTLIAMATALLVFE